MSKVGALLAKDARVVARDGYLFFLLFYGHTPRPRGGDGR